MAASSALTLLESLARRAESRSDRPGVAIRTQLAFVRALVDEVRRRSDEAHKSALLTQLDDEVARLARLMNDDGAGPPPSGVRMRA